MSDIAILVDNLSKEYPIGRRNHGGERAHYRSLRDLLAESAARPLYWARNRLGGVTAGSAPVDETFWALKDLSFVIKRGEVVGLIGRNGAGKSTLLKILARIMEPTSGYAEVHGRLGSLLEVGTGFHPELTGRENIFLNGAILGMKRETILRQFDEIVAFAEVERFIDTPVKHYSSGMYLRLAFAVAAHLETDILLVDEVLAVGDAQFQKKCLGKMDDVAKGGRTVLLVSHNLAAISALCPRVLYLSDGQLQADGETHASILHYMATVEQKVSIPLAERTDRIGDGAVRITHLRWLDAKTKITLPVVMSGQELYLEVGYAAAPTHQKPISNLEINIGFRTQMDQFVMALNSRMANHEFEESLPATGQLYCHIDRFPLMPGRFFGNGTLKLNDRQVDNVRHAFTTDVEGGDFFGTGIAYHGNQQSVYIPHQWLRELP